MERECFLTVLIALLGGIALLACGWWPSGQTGRGSARILEYRMWRRIWWTFVPALFVAAWLCGWAMAEPDPVPERVPSAVLLLSVPFLVLFARAAIRAVWSLFRDDGDLGTATVGLLKPWIVFSPHLAKALDDRAIEAALAHERSHVRHRDPLRIWLAQVVTDLQWPWPQARKRFRAWIVALELARDEEARAAGADGSDLASAILAAARIRQHAITSPVAALIGDQSVLKQRIVRLLNPLADPAGEIRARWERIWLLAPVLLIVVMLGSAFGEIVVRSLLRMAA